MRMREVFAGRTLRLALAFALAVAAITTGAFAVVYFEVAREETRRVGAILTEEARANADAPKERLRAALAARQLSDIRRIDFLALFDASGATEFGNVATLSGVPIDGLPHFIDARALRNFTGPPAPTMVVARRRDDGGVLLLGRTLLDSYEVEETLWRALTLALAPTVALFIGIGALFARQAARRLTGVHEAIGRILSGDFASRLPVSRDGDEIDRLAAAVNKMLDEIARLLKRLKNAGDNIAHELRAPLAVARAKLEHALGRDCGEERARVEAALEQLDRAAQTIAALLRIADVRNGRHEERFRDVDLADICAQTLEFYEPLADSRSVSMKTLNSAPVIVRGDEDLLREAISNLVDNAVKFTPPGGEVALAVENIDGRLRLEVRDTGPGVAPADRARVFERFYRAKAGAHVSGHGLGLNIAQAIAEAHGLELRIEDSAQGALFVIGTPQKL